jgi:hypothetical protein
MSYGWHPDFHRRAVENIVAADRMAKEGKIAMAKHHVAQARVWIDHNVVYLKGKGQNAEANTYASLAEEHLNRIERIAKSEDKGSLMKVSTPQLKGSAGEAFRRRMGGELESKATVGKVTPSSQYHYKKLHELSAEDQTLAHHKFGSKEMASHEYPTHLGTGRLVHSGRIPLRQPRAEASSYPVLHPEPRVKAGMGVDIHPSSGLTHRFGIVEGPSVHNPGSMNVRVGHKSYAHIKEEHLTPRKPKGRIEKALSALCDLKKREK